MMLINSTFIGVIAIELSLQYITNFGLTEINFENMGTSNFLITENSNNLEVLASSTLETSIIRQNDSKPIILYANELDDDVSDLSDTANFLLNMANSLNYSYGLTEISTSNSMVEITRRLDDPLTFIKRIITSNGLDWILIFTTQANDFYGNYVDMRTFNMFLSLASVSVIYFLIYKTLNKFTIGLKFSDAAKKDIRNIGEGYVNSEILHRLKERIKYDIIESFAAVWKRHKLYESSQLLPISYDELYNYQQELAVDHILHSNNNGNIIEKCKLEQVPSKYLRKLYAIVNSNRLFIIHYNV